MGRPGRPDMKVLVLVVAASAVALAIEMGDEAALCLSEMEVHALCGKGTRLQAKMNAALKECVPEEVYTMAMEEPQHAVQPQQTKTAFTTTVELPTSARANFDMVDRRGKGKKKPSKKPSKSTFESCEASCPTMEEIKAKGMEKMKTEVCVMKAIGWIDTQGNEMKEVVAADMSEFPAGVVEAVKESNVKACSEKMTAKKMDEMMKDKKFQRKYGACFKNQCYSDEQNDMMAKMMEMQAGLKCWNMAFTKSCSNHIGQGIQAMMMGQK